MPPQEATPRLPFDPLALGVPSRRFPTYARGGMVCCSNPQAAAAGLQALRAGGTAADAAVAAAATLTVVEPTANGIGSDAFAQVWSVADDRLFGLNSSGRSPLSISREGVLAARRDEAGAMPRFGWTPVTVPGAPRAWAELVRRFGRRTLAQDLAPAVRYARDGFVVTPNVADMWARGHARYAALRDAANGVAPVTCGSAAGEPLSDAERTRLLEQLGAPGAAPGTFDAWHETFAPQGRAPLPGEVLCLPDHARTLAAIGATDARAFYEGDVAQAIDATSRARGGYLRADDLAAHEALWVEPLSVGYHGYTVCEIPPNGQGIAALVALNALNALPDLPSSSAPELYAHRQIEAMKIGFADAFRYVTDPDVMELDPRALLTPTYGAARAAEIGEHAADHGPANPHSSGTVYLCCADGEGNMVSYIQSNYMGFGSGVVVNGTGVSLQNRGHDFSLDPAAANVLAPRKRTYHTIIPGFLMRDGAPVGPFGVMGGYMQPQGHVQVVCNYVDRRMNPQQALDAPRWQWLRDGSVIVEAEFDPDLARRLRRRGHDVRVELDTPAFGRGQMIVRDPHTGVLVGGCEGRTDSLIACW